MKNLHFIIDPLLLLVGILPLCLLFFKKRAFSIKEPIAPFVWLTALATLYEVVGTGVFKINATYWFQLYGFLCFGTLLYFFYNVLNQRPKKIIAVFASGFIIIFGISLFFFDKENVFISSAINELFMLIFVLVFTALWVKQLFEKLHIPNLWNNADFYFIAGLLIYHSSTILFFIFIDFLFQVNSYFYPWLLNIIATVVLRIFISMGVWKMNKA